MNKGFASDMHLVLDTIAEAIGRGRSVLSHSTRRTGRRAALKSFIALGLAGTAYSLYQGSRLGLADRQLTGSGLGFDRLPMNKLMLQRSGFLERAPVELVEYSDSDLDLQDQDPSLAFVDKTSGEDFDSMLTYLLETNRAQAEQAASSIAETTPPTAPTVPATAVLNAPSPIISSTSVASLGAVGAAATGIAAPQITLPSSRPSLPVDVPLMADMPTLPAQRGSSDIPVHVALNDAPSQVPVGSLGSRLNPTDEANQLAGMTPIETPLDLDRASADERTLTIASTHTGEKLRVRFVSKGRYDRGALAELSHLLRDHRNGQVRDIDRSLFDAAHQIAMQTRGSDSAVLHLVSGYRSPETNQLLRERSAGVAKNSYHVRGRAMDFFVEGAEIRDVYIAALRSDAGGVGFYPSSNFVHIDTGPTRSWPAQYRPLASQYRA